MDSGRVVIYGPENGRNFPYHRLLRVKADLSVTMDRYFSYVSHVENIYAKASGVLYFLHRNKNNFDKESRKLVIVALVVSVLSYCSTIWSGSSSLNTHKIQKIQNFASKVAVGHGRKCDHATPYINEMEWLKIESKIVYDVSVFTYKVLHGYTPERTLTLETVAQRRSRQTRLSNQLAIPARRTKIADRATSIRGAKFWNALPHDVRECESLYSFKKKLKSHLIQS